jgi:peroxiredoxin
MSTTADAGKGAAGEGIRIPDVRVHLCTKSSARGVSSAELFAGRRVVAFALPGAFTPTCSSQHLPRYEELMPVLEQHVDAVLCIAPNDPYVVEEWARQQGVERVQMVADGNCDFTRAMGFEIDHSAKGMGLRTRRYSMFVRDGMVEKLFMEPDEPGDPYGVSDADTMLDYLAPGSPRPPRIVVFSKPYCPHCARAKKALDARGLRYHEVPLGDGVRGFVLGAIASATTAPQVFIDGRLIGGEEELSRYLGDRDQQLTEASESASPT